MDIIHLLTVHYVVLVRYFQLRFIKWSYGDVFMLNGQVLEAFASWLRLKHGYGISLCLGLYLNFVHHMVHY